jgi:uncharacterized RDD family membrane protein YckC
MYSNVLAKKRERIVAFVIDYFIYFIIVMLFALLFGEEQNEVNGYSVTGFPAFILFLIGLFLWPFSEAYYGQTMGKSLMNLKVVSEDYKQIRTRQAFLRFFFGIFDLMILCIGLIVASSNKNNQRIGDIIAKTLVVKLNTNDKNPS